MGYRVLLTNIRIKNFRSILDESISIDQYNIFVGLNDCGKSNVLKALNLFFNGETDFGTKFNFSSDYCQKGKTGKGKAKEITIELSFLLPEQVVDKGIKTWKKIWRAEGLHSDNLNSIFGPYSKGPTFLSRIIFEYVPAVKSSGYFKDLLLDMYNAMTGSANTTLAKVNSQYSVTLQSLTKQLNKNIKEQIGLDSIVKMPDNLGVLFRDMQISTKDKYVSNINLDNRGDGIKARHIPSMLLFISQKIKENREKNAVGYTVLWGYEEPENGVEFIACEKLAEELYSYSNECQILLTTHSPAVYSTKDNNNAKCYYAYKNESGLSKYEPNFSIAEINNNIGVMPLITPYLVEAKKEIEKRQEENRKLNADLKILREKSNKIIIYTEGVTDGMYLDSCLKGLPYYSRIEINPYISDLEFGDSNLNDRFSALQLVSPDNIKICMFDRDNTRYIINEEYLAGQNRTYKFSIPVPSFRSPTDKIAIEHYFKDNEIMTEDADGHRLFMAKEFAEDGTTIDDKYYCKYPIRVGREDPLHIFDGRDENTKVYLRKQTENMALPKKKFATYVTTKHNGFDFNMDEFKLITNIITKIVNEADAVSGE